MNVYRFAANGDGFRVLVLRPGRDGPIAPTPQRGVPIADGWQAPVYVDSDEADDFGTPPLARPFGDFFSLSAGEIGVVPATLHEVGDLLRRSGELLPIRYLPREGAEEQLFYYRLTRMLDAFDEHRFIGRRADRLCFPDRYAFVPAVLAGVEAFELPQVGGRYCTDLFKGCIDVPGLVGLDFRLVWSDESEGMKQIMDWERRAGYKDLPPMGA